MVLPLAIPALVGASQIGAGATAGAGLFGAGGSGAAILSALSGALAGGLKARGDSQNAKEQKRKTRAELLAQLLKQQQEESIMSRQIENQRTSNQGSALQEMANGFRASLTGR